MNDYFPCVRGPLPNYDETAPECAKCDDTGWLPEIEGRDGSYITSRPCTCEAGDTASRLS